MGVGIICEKSGYNRQGLMPVNNYINNLDTYLTSILLFSSLSMYWSWNICTDPMTANLPEFWNNKTHKYFIYTSFTFFFKWPIVAQLWSKL